MSQILQEVLAANAKYVAGFGDKGKLALPPARRFAILTCMDARLLPARFLGLEIGDAHVIRNAGGRASDDSVRSLAISQQLLGTNEVVVIHHTDCGMLTFGNEDLRKKLKQQLNADAEHIDFLPFKDLEQSVRDDVATIQNSPLILKNIEVSGFIYDVKSGKLLPIT